MADDERRQDWSFEDLRSATPTSPYSGRPTGWLTLVVLALVVLLTVGQVYTYLQVKQFSELGRRIEEQSAARQEALKKEMEERMASLTQAYQRSARGVQQDVMTAAGSVMATHEELRRAKVMTEKLQAEQHQTAAELARQLVAKADQQQVGALSQDVSATRQELDSTKKSLQETIEKLGMTRSELGTLIARNHEEIEQLRRLGDRDYFEITLGRLNTQYVAGVGLRLRKTSAKKFRYTLDLFADDVHIEKKDRTINEPIFFYVRSHKAPLELVVNRVEDKRVVGYVSVPKEPMASEGTAR